jgi:HSP20 family molecular chaperone IbpA
MSLILRDPNFASLRGFFDDFFDTMSERDMTTARTPATTRARTTLATVPRIDLSETSDGKFLLAAEMPGYLKEDVKLDVDEAHHQLTISAEQREETDEERAGYHIRERRYGKIHRVVPFPETADLAHSEAVMENGVLRIQVPKLAQLPGTRSLLIK